MVDESGEVLGADGEDGIEIGEVVEDEVSGFAGRESLVVGGIDDLYFEPGGAVEGGVFAEGVALRAEFGHSVLVNELLFGDLEVTADEFRELIGVMFGVDSLEASGLEHVTTGREWGGRGGVAEVEKAEAGAEEGEGVACGEGREVEGLIGGGEPALWVVIRAEDLEHVRERGVRRLGGRAGGEVGFFGGGEIGVSPAMDDGGLVELEVAEVMFAFRLGGGARGEEGADGFPGGEANEGEAGFEGVGGDGRDVLPAGDLVRGVDAQGAAVGLVGGVAGELVGEEVEGQFVKVGLSSTDPSEERLVEGLTVRGHTEGFLQKGR